MENESKELGDKITRNEAVKGVLLNHDKVQDSGPRILNFFLFNRLGDYLMDCDDFWCKISGNASTFWENQNFWSRTATISHKVDFSKMIFSIGQGNPILAVVWQCGTKNFDFPRKYMYFLRVCAKNHPIPSSSLWDLWIGKSSIFWYQNIELYHGSTEPL